jgi:hypothetical protein
MAGGGSRGTGPQNWSNLLMILIGLLPGLAAVAALSQEKFISFGLFLGAVVPWALLTVDKVRNVASQPWVPALALSISLAAAGYVTLDDSGREAPGNTRVAPVSSPSPALAPIRFNEPGGKVPYCNDLSGTGTIPAGQVLAIFDHGLSEANEPYWFDQLAEPAGDGWRARDISLGDGEKADEGKDIELSAVLVPADIGKYLTSIDAENFWWSSRLPTEPVAKIGVVRNEDVKPCG